jgi:putative PEP-CTERM system histidine kinase
MSATVGAWSFGLALAGYLAFAIRIFAAAMRNARARLLLAALVFTALWAACSIMVTLDGGPVAEIGVNAADALRYAAWFAFLAHLLAGEGDGVRRRYASSLVVAIGAVLVARVMLGDPFDELPGLGPRAGLVVGLGLAVFGLMQLEQLVRRVDAQARWNVKPLAVALAGVFGFDLFFYADAMLFGRIDPDIWLARGAANALVLPFLAIATVRNTQWTIDLHLSRGAVMQSSALLASGAFLLAIAAAGYYVRYFGGDWARALSIELVFAGVLVLALVVSSGRFRSFLRVFISKHFFSYRYDYREEWLRFTRTLSTESPGETLPMRIVHALGDLVESPGGVLFVRDDGRGYVPDARWNSAAPAAAAGGPDDSAFSTFLQRTGWIVDTAECSAYPERYEGVRLPSSVAAIASSWLVVPLISGTDLLAFVVLTSPRTHLEVDWEVRDLLKTASRQAASYLGHVQATEALLEARKFEAFNRMSAFIVHDLKNLIAQLSLMLKNAKRHRDNPEFQADMLATVEHVVERMNALMLQLRSGTTAVENAGQVDLCAVVRRACAAKSDARVPFTIDAPGTLLALGHDDRLERVIGHLLQNAIDASLPSGAIDVGVEAGERHATVRVRDRGAGMSAQFIRERLFKPFQTTKAAGMGIGVYESSQYVASIGGEIRVESEEGTGTCIEVRLPRIDVAGSSAAAVIQEQVA